MTNNVFGTKQQQQQQQSKHKILDRAGNRTKTSHTAVRCVTTGPTRQLNLSS